MVIAISDDGMVVELNADGTWERTSRVQAGVGDFRGVAWGSAVEEVRRKEEGDTSFESDSALAYPQRLCDMDADVVYLFVAGRLTRAKYMFNEEFTSANRYLDGFLRVKSLFEGKYGAVVSDDMLWHDDLYRDSPDDWGKAVERGDLTLLSTWSTPKTEIALILHGNDYESHITVEYTAVEWKSWAESIERQSAHGLI